MVAFRHHGPSNQSYSDGKMEEMDSHVEDCLSPKLDRHGLLLVPQPGDHEDDPLLSSVMDKLLMANLRRIGRIGKRRTLWGWWQCWGSWHSVGHIHGGG